ncbi:MAG: response regulator [Calditrichaeota bacterium]|nr:MAG: response regulator [Calditrichota bacterium]
MSERQTVLIIEDDIHYGEMLRDGLEHFGYHVYLAYSATGGMDIIKQKKIHLIISDINMPGINGIQLAEKLQEMYLNIPIVLITGLQDISLVKKAVERGVSDYLIKPIKLEDLPVVVEKNLQMKNIESQMLFKNKSEILVKALRALMRALDAKDSYTSGHSQRVVRLAMKMARELHLSEDETYILQLSALLHDIGKIGIPDKILKKAASLEDYELNIARDHPIIGSEIIGEIEELSEVASVVRHHHERYDGSGYPDGLKGDAIPYFSRVLAIIDSYEALISDRIYRKGVGKQAALMEIKANAGTQFDPELVDVFIKIMQDQNGQSMEMDDDLSKNIINLSGSSKESLAG